MVYVWMYQDVLPIATEMAGVKMRLLPNGEFLIYLLPFSVVLAT